MAEEDLTAEIERLKAENERLRTRPSRVLSMKVSQKGALSVYGLGRFPVTLYKEQWTILSTPLTTFAGFLRTTTRNSSPRGRPKETGRRNRYAASHAPQRRFPPRPLRRDRPHRRGWHGTGLSG